MPITVGNVIGSAIDVADIAGSFKESRKKGVGFVGSTARASVKQAAWMFGRAGMFTSLGVSLVSAGAQGAKAYGAGAGKVQADMQERQYSHKLGGGNYMDTQMNATMRQRGMRAIEQSSQNLNSVFGSEARTYFRGSY